MHFSKRFFAAALAFALFFSLLCAVLPAYAASGPQLKTTLRDGALQRGSRKTFDVWASNAAGQKIKCFVTLNDEELSPTWDDSEKTSYTLHFTKEGDNLVTVSATSDGGQRTQLSYRINYQKANPGDYIGSAIFSIEAFTIGCGYLIAPVSVPIYEGETSAQQLIRLLHKNGLVGYYGGRVDSAFYLAYIADGTASNAKYNNYQKSGTASSPRKLGISPSVPAILRPYLEKTMTFYDPDDYAKNWTGYLGEFAITNGSGWMYCINNVFPNVGFADSFLGDGDVVRVQFTLGYGADIGGFGAIGTEIPDVSVQPSGGYFAVSDKDGLTKALCRAAQSSAFSAQNVQAAYEKAVECMAALDASQSTVNAAASALQSAVSNPVWESETTAAPTTAPAQSSAAAAPSHSQGQTAPGKTPGNTSAPLGSAANGDSFQESETPAVSEENEALTTAAEQLPHDTAAEPSKGNAPVQSKGTAPLIIGILIGVLLLCGIAAALFFLLRHRRAEKTAPERTEPEKEGGDLSESEKSKAKAGEAEQEKAEKKGTHDDA